MNYQSNIITKNRATHTGSEVVKLLLFALITLNLNAQNTYSDINDIRNAMANAKPGDEIIIAPGTYTSQSGIKDANGNFVQLTGGTNGDKDNPIILRGAIDPQTGDKPTLTMSGSKLFMTITGDYWILKDFNIHGAKKGIILDDANHCQLINLEVHDIGEEAIHLRSNSSHNLIQNCNVHDTGITNSGIGEGIYIGTDRKNHNIYAPNCDNNTIDNCHIGPFVRAEGIDIKEGTQNTIVRNCTFDAKGISGQNSADAFIDLKGSMAFIYNNTFNRNGSTVLSSGIDFQKRIEGNTSGYRNAIFNNTFNFDNVSNIPTARKKGGDVTEMHIWDNTRGPDTDNNFDNNSNKFVNQFCPSWNIVKCSTLSVNTFENSLSLTLYPNPTTAKLKIIGLKQNEVKFTIYNILGQAIRKGILQTNNVAINVSELQNGLYIITLEKGNDTISKKFHKI